MTAISLPAARRLDARQTRRLAAIGLAVAAVVLYVVFRGQSTLPHDEEAPIFQWFNGLRDTIDASRATNPIFLYIIDPLRQVIDQLVEIVLDTLRAIGWTGVIGAAGVIGFLAGGWRVALLAVTGFAILGVLGLWDESLDTLGLTLAAVALSLLIGIPLGILAGRSDGFQRVVIPILDVMQIMPAFAYLGIITLLLRIGGAAAAIATLIYAMPAAIRITSLGDPRCARDDGRGGGIARRDPRADAPQGPAAARPASDRPGAINQTIMLALSMVVDHRRSSAHRASASRSSVPSRRTNVGAAFDAGIAIVILAIVLDRITEHWSAQQDARRPIDPVADRRRRRMTIAALAIGAVAIAVGVAQAWAQEFPSAIAVSFEDPVNAAADWIKTNMFFLTDWLKDAFTSGSSTRSRRS